MADYRHLSLWHDTLVGLGRRSARPPGRALDGDTEADVCVVGAGYTGLWTAYWLLVADPTLRVVVLEAEVAGFGASGPQRAAGARRCSPPRSRPSTARHGPRGRARHAPGDERDGRLGGARRRRRGDRRALAPGRHRGDGPHARAARRARPWWPRTPVTRAWTVSCCWTPTRPAPGGRVRGPRRYVPAALRPGAPRPAVRGLARACERRGAVVHERTPVTACRPAGAVRAGAACGDRPRARSGARTSCVATEAWTARLPGWRRAVAPVYSLMVATEPLPASFWATAGLAGGETFTDHRHLDHLRPAHGRRPVGVRRPRGAVPLRVAGAARASTVTSGCSPGLRVDAGRAVPGLRGARLHARLGWSRSGVPP
jgi:glycine/D-amino acid oxidase-like deaminating enzyme